MSNKDNKKVGLPEAAKKLDLGLSVLRRDYVNDDSENFDPTKLNTTRFKKGGHHKVTIQEINRFKREARKG